MAEVHGSCDDRFRAVREALEQHLDDDELGASIAVDLDGETVVDLWGGYRDEARTTPWTEDTIVNVWSTTKTRAVARGADARRPGGAGRRRPGRRLLAGVLREGEEGRPGAARHVAHLRGVRAGTRRSRSRTCTTGRSATERLALQRPWWEPGTASGYHAQNQGHLVGELIRRITGRTFKQFVAEEIAGPVGADFQVGCVEQDWDRVAPVVPPPPLPFDLSALDPASPLVRTFTGPVASAGAANSPTGGRPTWAR